VLQHHAVFVNALRGGHEIRKRVFDVIEQYHANDFGNGMEGIELYEELLSALRDSGMPEVVKEFERRFAPLLKLTAVRHRRRLDWSRMAILYVAAFVGTFILAVSVLRITATEPPVIAATIPSAKAAQPVSEAITDPVVSARHFLLRKRQNQFPKQQPTRWHQPGQESFPPE
jgi:hypothetical protein